VSMAEKNGTRDLYLEERQQEIVRQVNRVGRASVSELADRFGVSEVTIRGDLRALAARELILRTHGGAVPIGRAMRELSLADRSRQQVAEKERIGKAAAAMVSDGEAIILDSSSTALAVARHLKQHRDVTILTNSLAVAREMLDATGVTVVMPGGTVRRDMASLTGGHGLEVFREFNIYKGFFGATGISPSEGLTDVSVGEAEVKRPLVAMCREVVAVLDATKWGRVGVASFASLDSIDGVITDVHAPPELVDQVRMRGVEVTCV
jgi:DeoR/GlpR family transcriptional regulator of sugar metabolism